MRTGRQRKTVAEDLTGGGGEGALCFLDRMTKAIAALMHTNTHTFWFVFAHQTIHTKTIKTAGENGGFPKLFQKRSLLKRIVLENAPFLVWIGEKEYAFMKMN